MYVQTEDLGVLQAVFAALAIAFAFKTGGWEATEDGFDFMHTRTDVLFFGFDATKRRLDIHLHG